MKKRGPIVSAPLLLLERYRLIAFPADNARGLGWEIYDCEEALEQHDYLASGPNLSEAITEAVRRLEDWIN